MHIGFASVAEVDRLWPMIVADIQKACRQAPELLTAGELWQMCRSGNGFLCIVHDGDEVFASSVLRFEDDALRVWVLAGKDMRQWIGPFYEFCKKVGSENGANRLLCRGRRGWLRMFKGSQEIGEDYEVRL